MIIFNTKNYESWTQVISENVKDVFKDSYKVRVYVKDRKNLSEKKFYFVNVSASDFADLQHNLEQDGYVSKLMGYPDGCAFSNVKDVFGYPQALADR